MLRPPVAMDSEVRTFLVRNELPYFMPLMVTLVGEEDLPQRSEDCQTRSVPTLRSILVLII
jgi:hypothetical protein